MPIWQIEFFPPSGERNSPSDYPQNLQDKSDQAQIMHRLGVMRESEIGDWPKRWRKKIKDKILQLPADNQRVLYCLDKRTIIVLHICKKVGQKARTKDIKMAVSHFHNYLAQKKGR